ncbi:HAD-IA family hydrolase [Orrella daihaiensis]|uniref:HAD-IA family hydrolase n=1 Tax=Orrella daihaiensis TaxID=2782176 RepID=A0ABY4AKF8_9BURK|nr:HAD-IA family hydrolase [Orrella daihaiensis]UOD49600.1 HAD-IA family hydrolase [Orrella daihaiensis]
MSQYELVVFDWDGTLMDSTGGIVRAIQSASRDMGFEVPDDHAAAWVIGLSLDEALERLAPKMTNRDREKYLERYRYHYLTQDMELRLFDGVIPMLDALSNQGVMMAVATGKSRVGLNRALHSTGLGQYFAVTRCADETHGKPNPRMLLEIMADLATKPDAAVMIGDTTHDLGMAANAGIHGLGVSYGAHPVSELRTHPHLDIVDSVAGVHDWLKPRTRGIK